MSDVESVPIDPAEQEADALNSSPEEAPEFAEREDEVTSQPEAEQAQEVEVIPPEAGDEGIEEVSEAVGEGELEALRAELEQAQAQAAEYLSGWQRARAEFANYKKRQEAEREELRRTSTQALLLKLLPVVDDFERALQTVPKESAGEGWLDGTKMILRKLQALLESEDVTPIEAAGQPFDPLWHEAILQEETDEHPDGYVIEEMQRGYRLGNRVLRPSMVKVASNANESINELEPTEE
jgi:molecular chaperone GrpE